ncbi:hypothetical protein FOZ63_028295 [Perkinsus olseni]|uniref:Uncharacterized protein n=1 Tax=Perkinsus olseni TaxID=32597 RepID=A0A7J6U354_PEROL|nr:hypothetical protein FOZ63_028295 [Perkinsus olseni]
MFTYLSILPVVLLTIITTANALQTGPQPEVTYRHGTCKKEYDPANDEYPRLKVTWIEGFQAPVDDLIAFDWEECGPFSPVLGNRFDFWYSNGKMGAGGSRMTEPAMANLVKTSVQRFKALGFDKVNPFAHVWKEAVKYFDQPMNQERCEELFNYIENTPAEGYSKGIKWIPNFVQANLETFFQMAKGERAEQKKIGVVGKH